MICLYIKSVLTGTPYYQFLVPVYNILCLCISDDKEYPLTHKDRLTVIGLHLMKDLC